MSKDLFNHIIQSINKDDIDGFKHLLNLPDMYFDRLYNGM